MTDPASNLDLERQAQLHFKQGAPIKAMQIYYELHERDPDSTHVLSQLVALNLQLGVLDQATINLQKLIMLEPSKAVTYDQLANVYDQLGMWSDAAEIYKTLIMHRPMFPEARFNQAYYLRRAGKFEEAIESYRQAIKHGIENPEEVHLNIANILADDLRREAEAEQELQTALEVNDQYLPAHYNLANLFEDRGQRAETIEQFEKILSINPVHPQAMARLATLLEDEDHQGQLLARLAAVGDSEEISLSDKIDAHYAFGQVHDRRQEYDRAFYHYKAANEFNKAVLPPYSPEATQASFDKIIERFSKDWIETNQLETEAAPVFICGMFRSGSTLIEQMLAAHPDVTPGGERDTLLREFSKPSLQFPSGPGKGARASHLSIAKKYTEATKKVFPDAKILTDKRPDNFQYLGLIKTIFPKARFICTLRQPIDNCLSVYFVRLGQTMNYATDLSAIAHYYDQHLRLLEHWKATLGDDLIVVDYDELVANPRTSVETALAHLSLQWHDDCLRFHELQNTVKTASVWQIRRPLYKSSSGRWQNYEAHIGGLIEHFRNSTTQAST